MGIAAYNRASAVISEVIRRDFEPRRAACEERTADTNIRMMMDRQADEIARLRRNLTLVRDGKERNHKAWCKLDAHFRGYRRHAAGMIKRLIEANTNKERQRAKLARCVREHLTHEQWLEWSAQYDKENR